MQPLTIQIVVNSFYSVTFEKVALKPSEEGSSEMTKVLPFIEKSYSKMSIEIRFPLNENSYSPVDFIGEEDTVLSISTFSLFGC